MIIAVCVDNNLGMLFNNRRQSRDKYLLARLVEKAGQNKLWINNFSQGLFAEINCEHLTVAHDFLHQAQQGEYCFVENVISEIEPDKIKKIILYKWNRDYPADSYFTWPSGNWQLVSSEDFAGFSHEKITEEVYVNA